MLRPETVKTVLDVHEGVLKKQLADAQRSAGKGIVVADLNLEMAKRRLATFYDHRAKLSPAGEAMELAAIKGVAPDQADQWVDEPGFFSTSTPTRIQLITVTVLGATNAAPAAVAANAAWVKQVIDTIDDVALAKLLNEQLPALKAQQ
jgi:hypothetical protein